MAERPRLLLIDDGEDYARVIAERLPEFELVDPGAAGVAGLAAGLGRAPDGPAALAFLARHAAEVDVALLDMRFDVPEDRLLAFPEGTSLRRQRRFQGLAILRALREAHPDLPVVVLTAVEDLSLLDAGEEVAGLSLTYVLDSNDLDALRIRIGTALAESGRAAEEQEILWGRDAGMRAVRRRLRVLARGRLPVILEGETGTGKSWLAERALHAASGRPGPFVVLDLATVPTELISAHLFGAVRGAYTGSVADRKGVFELANGGTLFIDEVQNAPLEVQKQLLLVLQDRRVRPLGASREVPVDVKVVAASNVPLAEAVQAGRFRPDLYMRLGPATRVTLPPLRARPADLPFLARRLVERAVADPDVAALRDRVALGLGLGAAPPMVLQIGREAGEAPAQTLVLALPQPAWNRLARHRWPGNLRELAMVLHNLVTFTLVAAADALDGGVALRNPRLQVDSGLVASLLAGSAPLGGAGAGEPDGTLGGAAGGASEADAGRAAGGAPVLRGEAVVVRLAPAGTLNHVAAAVERQYFLALWQATEGDFEAMALRLLGDAGRGRAIRLRFNQLGLKVRDLKPA